MPVWGQEKLEFRRWGQNKLVQWGQNNLLESDVSAMAVYSPTVAFESLYLPLDSSTCGDAPGGGAG
ncbi:hypothetical protein C1I95_30525 [Micromonospora craterilacus]|uniref:Uncharacterized protein n=2 Tax=Micromonospora craterilacus TaxID=1655439 RepID=A0A2W2E7C5_9ACTN|nr:hypothetical protein C1I95_30525 [Micromonospora craterilacus]